MKKPNKRPNPSPPEITNIFSKADLIRSLVDNVKDYAMNVGRALDRAAAAVKLKKSS